LDNADTQPMEAAAADTLSERVMATHAPIVIDDDDDLDGKMKAWFVHIFSIV